MKPTTIVPYAFFIVFIITTQSIPSINPTSTAAASERVYDVSGKKVLNNVFYHIGPVVWAKGGGIKATDTKNNKKYLVQDPAEVKIGGKFMFTLISDQEKQEKYLETSHILGIDSGRPKEGSCEKWTFWQISDADAKAPSNLITTGGTFEEDESCFQVVNYPKPTSPKIHSYMLQHCPSFCGGGPPRPCYNISIYEDKGVKHLGVTGGTPFEFVFQKAK